MTKLTTASDSLRSLLEEASQRKSLEFAYQEPLWATWPLDRFGKFEPPLRSLAPLTRSSTDTFSFPCCSRTCFRSDLAISHLDSTPPAARPDAHPIGRASCLCGVPEHRGRSRAAEQGEARSLRGVDQPPVPRDEGIAELARPRSVVRGRGGAMEGVDPCRPLNRNSLLPKVAHIGLRLKVCGRCCLKRERDPDRTG